MHMHVITKNMHEQGNRRYQTLPALCNLITPFAADRPHCMRPEIFRILFVLAWHTEWSLLLHDVIGDWMIPIAVNAATTLQRPLPRRLPVLLNGLDNRPKIALFPWGICTPSNTWFFGLPILRPKGWLTFNQLIFLLRAARKTTWSS